MIYIILLISAIILTNVAFKFGADGSYGFACILYVICAIIFVIVGIHFIAQDKLFLGIIQIAGAVVNIIGIIHILRD